MHDGLLEFEWRSSRSTTVKPVKWRLTVPTARPCKLTTKQCNESSLIVEINVNCWPVTKQHEKLVQQSVQRSNFRNAQLERSQRTRTYCINQNNAAAHSAVETNENQAERGGRRLPGLQVGEQDPFHSVLNRA